MTYELFVWLKPDLSSDQVKKEVKDMEEFIKDVKKLQSENLGRKKLAYKIKGFEEGIQLGIKLECNPERISDLSIYLNRDDSVLRYLITKNEK